MELKKPLHKNYPKLYGVWNMMKQRCSNPKVKDFHRWGGRGIKVCESWLTAENFFTDMLPSYKEGLTLDRKDNNGNYSPENCHWVDRKYQATNRKNTRLFKHDKKEMTLSGWARHLGVKRSLLASRYYCLGWSIERTLTT
jgi:hypothetical protein